MPVRLKFSDNREEIFQYQLFRVGLLVVSVDITGYSIRTPRAAAVRIAALRHRLSEMLGV